MRKFLSLVLCLFSLQFFSCSEVEAIPEATKFIIQNNSSVVLAEVKWNGTEFDDMLPGEISEQLVRDGISAVFFKLHANGKAYRTQAQVKGEKFKDNKFSFVDGTIVIPIDNITFQCPLSAALTCGDPSSSSNAQSSSSRGN